MQYSFTGGTDDLDFKSDIGFSLMERTYTTQISMDKNHYHHHYELLYVYQNSRILEIGGEQYTLNKNCIALLPPLLPHKTLPGEMFPQSRLLVNFRHDFIENINSMLKVNLFSCFDTQQPIISLAPFMNDFEYILSAIKSDASGEKTDMNIAKLKIHICDLLLLLVSHSSQQNQYENDCYKILKYIEKNFNKKITLEHLEEHFHFSKYTISRKLNSFANTSLPKYLNSIRVIHARKFLEENDKILDIVEKCGFSSQSDFNRVFKAETGQTPLEYKKKIHESIIDMDC